MKKISENALLKIKEILPIEAHEWKETDLKTRWLGRCRKFGLEGYSVELKKAFIEKIKKSRLHT